MGSLCTVINSQLSPKGEDKTGGMLGTLPDGLDRPYTKNIMQEMPRTWENKRQSNGSMTQSSLQDSAELADHRGEKGSERQQTFFSHRENYCNSWIYQVVAARTGGTSVTFFPLQQLPHPCFPATSWFLADTQWCSSDWGARPLSLCHISELNVAADRVWGVSELPDTTEVTQEWTRNREEEETAGIPCPLPLRSTRFNQVTSRNFKLFGTTQALRI